MCLAAALARAVVLFVVFAIRKTRTPRGTL
jgi:hypothetical protein